MPKRCYVNRNFSPESLRLIEQANTIIEDYQAQGYSLTLRQLYYQFVSRDLIPNKVTEYKRLGSIVNDARLAGLIDWLAIEDRTRNLSSPSHWDSPAAIVATCAEQFQVDLWSDQPHRVEVWIEKEALAGVFERACDTLRVPFFSCRGYTSQSEMWGAAMRMRKWSRGGQTPIILHFGDHDPSGIDMTRDIRERLALFGADLEVNRLALNMDQITEYDPPPNPAKETDSRFRGYLREYGDESWELDALEPSVLAGLVRDAVSNLIDWDRFDARTAEEDHHRTLLKAVSRNWGTLTQDLGEEDE